jgi:hypothetical protein
MDMGALAYAPESPNKNLEIIAVMQTVKEVLRHHNAKPTQHPSLSIGTEAAVPSVLRLFTPGE